MASACLPSSRAPARAAKQAQGRDPPVMQHQPTALLCTGRRCTLLLALPALTWAVAVQPLMAANDLHEFAGGVDSASSPLIQELLKRTEEMREERKKERLDDYYRRNFSDYLSFQAGSPEARDGSENQEQIKKWLRQNTESPFPVRPLGQTFPPQQE